MMLNKQIRSLTFEQVLSRLQKELINDSLLEVSIFSVVYCSTGCTLHHTNTGCGSCVIKIRYNIISGSPGNILQTSSGAQGTPFTNRKYNCLHIRVCIPTVT